MLLLLISCSSLEQATDVQLSRIPQIAVEPSTYTAVMTSRGGCWEEGWMRSTLGGIPASVTMTSGGAEERRCAELGISWDGTEALDSEEQVQMVLADRVSSYPILLGNWPTAIRSLAPVDPFSGGNLAGSSVRFVLDGPGVLDSDTTVSLLTVGRVWEIPTDGGALRVEDRALEIDFPTELATPTELRIDGAWKTTVLDSDVDLPLSFHEADSGQVFEL